MNKIEVRDGTAKVGNQVFFIFVDGILRCGTVVSIDSWGGLPNNRLNVKEKKTNTIFPISMPGLVVKKASNVKEILGWALKNWQKELRQNANRMQQCFDKVTMIQKELDSI